MEEAMEFAPDALHAVLAALLDTQATITHPATVTPSTSKRVATHRVTGSFAPPL